MTAWFEPGHPDESPLFTATARDMQGRDPAFAPPPRPERVAPTSTGRGYPGGARQPQTFAGQLLAELVSNSSAATAALHLIIRKQDWLAAQVADLHRTVRRDNMTTQADIDRLTQAVQGMDVVIEDAVTVLTADDSAIATAIADLQAQAAQQGAALDTSALEAAVEKAATDLSTNLGAAVANTGALVPAATGGTTPTPSAPDTPAPDQGTVPDPVTGTDPNAPTPPAVDTTDGSGTAAGSDEA